MVPPVRKSLAERFHAKYREDPSGCWVWLAAAKTTNGYGQIGVRHNGKTYVRSAHRVAYELFNGPIPDGTEIDHLCHNRACVNPAHLKAVSRRENVSNRLGFAMSRPNRIKPLFYGALLDATRKGPETVHIGGIALGLGCSPGLLTRYIKEAVNNGWIQAQRRLPMGGTYIAVLDRRALSIAAGRETAPAAVVVGVTSLDGSESA